MKRTHIAVLALLTLVLGTAITSSCTQLLGIDTDYDKNPCLDADGGTHAEQQVCGKGACMVILPVCKEGLPVDCVGDTKAQQAEEACDGIDNNCNGGVDEGCPCMAGARQPCYTGPLATRNVGLCKDGVQLCENGVWSECKGAVTPQPETCNGFDDDCNGVIDEACPCTPQHQQQCYGFAQSTLESDAGAPCHKGTQTCQADGTWGSCSGQAGPSQEICNGIDDDCNGKADDGVSCECIQDADCPSKKCIDGKCTPEPTCMDVVKNGGETDVDCGGPDCGKCADTKLCDIASDCVSGVCTCNTPPCQPNSIKKCQKPSCQDNVVNQDETDVDCGGANCPGCDASKTCAKSSDCKSKICNPTSKTCQAPTCTDGVQNGDETDTDCGGMKCPGCSDGKLCTTGNDCLSKSCPANVCVTPSCNDGTKNGDETDKDCGGSCAKKCDAGLACLVSTDCLSNVCTSNVCQPASCNDGIKNGSETDKDCGGTCNPCGAGQQCSASVDCQPATCQGATTQINALTCGSNAHCTSNGTTDCTPFTCSTLTGKCRSSCTSDLDCSGAAFCNPGGICVLKLPNGGGCTQNKECSSSFCVDGFCCNNACTGACQACNVSPNAGTCTPVPFLQQDTPYCQSPSACNGMAACLLTNGQSCSQDTQCLSGFCVDSVCCGSPCAGTCQACNVPGSLGTCANVPAPQTDALANTPCNAPNACNGMGACVATNGQTCTLNSQCLSGFCVDGVCCNSACNGTCQACNVTGLAGVCSNVPASQQDSNAAPPCVAPSACNGAGSCLFTNGQACALDSQCLSGHCADGVCCNTACTSACQACNLAGSGGTCSNVASGQQDAPGCTGMNSCNGAGVCVLTNGQACTQNNQCLSGNCADGVCCNTACSGTCQACTAIKKGSGSDGSCGPVAPGTDPDTECTPYVCGNPGCLTKCVTDADCTAGDYCLMTACVQKKTNGAGCNAGNECTSGNCVDGVCCNSNCSGTCQACNVTGSQGTCTNVPPSQPDAPGCTAPSACNGSGSCLLTNGTVCAQSSQCLSGNCVDGVCCNSTCSGTCQACNVPGSQGTCTNVPASQADAPGCTAPNACNGAGSCLATNGTACTQGTQCLSGNCVDGVCCNTACSGTCQACNVTGSVGTCSNVPTGQQDSFPVNACTGNSSCDGVGHCVFNTGIACTLNSQCSTGFCVDGFCCDNACTGTCQACNVAGSQGTCTNVPAGQQDAPVCTGSNTCNGAGVCVLTNGQVCSLSSQCLSGSCVDGVCCSTACNGTCQACNIAGSVGTCSFLAAGQPDLNATTPCTAPSTCNGSGACLFSNGQTCTLNSQCASGNCVDGVCCNSACAGTCQACNVAGSLGTCTNVPSGQQDAPSCTGADACNGAGVCVLVDGQACSQNNQCLSGNCVDNVCCNTACAGACQGCTALKKGSGGDGVCGAVVAGTDPDKDCPPYVCGGTGCLTKCVGDTDCAAGAYCLMTACVSKKPNGQTCTSGNECTSGNCIDGYCCNSTCGAGCQACNVAGSLGTCTNVPNGQQDAPTCIAPSACNGSGSCLLTNGSACTQGNTCLSGNCVDGVCCNNACSGSCQACNITGSVGTCSNVPTGQQDAPACTAPNACNGSGSCVLINGQACSSNSQCLSGSCVDGVCCNTSCTGTCQACNVTGSVGTCTNTPAGQQDTFPANACTTPKACNGTGTCLLSDGQACSSASQCLSGNCVDGVCCNSACTGTCRACNVIGNVGACVNVPAGQQDSFPANACTGGSACDGAGTCLLNNGAACTLNTQCLSGSCVDGVCCNSTCAGTCQACNVAGSVGTCANVPAFQQDPGTCTAPNTCNGAGTCLANNGTTCTANTQCASGFCADGVCCNSACTGTCQACNVTGSIGTCSNAPAGQTDTNATTPCITPNACNGAGSCLADVGQPCGTNGALCASGFCVDGVCCNNACNGVCTACSSAKKGSGADGICGNVALDTDPKNNCGATTCNGAGACLSSCSSDTDCSSGNFCLMSACVPKRTNGNTCTGAGQCASGNCVDNTCCSTSACPNCQSCNINGSGTCAAVPLGQQDAPGCTGTSVCNGAGTCQLGNGQTCTMSSQCASGNCVDGFCCNSACTTPCQSCGVTGSVGICTNLPAGSPDTFPTNACTTQCDGSGVCQLANAAACTSNGQCVSGNCVDGVCCSTACTGTCQACNITGSVGTCTNIASGQPDNSPAGTCVSPSVCNGAGACVLTSGQSCSTNGQCSSGNCVDGVCCNTACTTTCQACNVSGSVGTCTNVPSGQTDNTCAAPSACNGSNGATACVLTSGQTCTTNAQCLSGNCVDGVCCNTACTTACQACNVSGSVGTCTNLLAGQTDTFPANACVAPSVCNGSGTCVLTNGQTCSSNGQCASGNCVDGVCCDSACNGICQACNVSGSVGTCTNVPSGQTDNTCAAPSACNGGSGASACLLTNGQACSSDGQCLNGNCVDGVCCNTACTTTCQACNVTGSIGTCTNVPTGQQDTGTCVSPSACNSAGACVLTNGETCAANGDCLSGNCVDGVCCNTACTGSCQACNVTGSVGTCTNVPFGQADDTCASGMTKACDGAGVCLNAATAACTAATASNCLNDLCVSSACTACGTSNPCGTGYTCSANGVCLGSGSKPCAASSQCQSPFACIQGGFCLGVNTTACTAAADCTSNRCNTNACAACTANSQCGTSGTCNGGICTFGNNASCQRHDQCTSNSCTGSSGTQCIGTCSSSSQCPSGYTCTSNICKGPTGTPCAVANQCGTGVCLASGFCQ